MKVSNIKKTNLKIIPLDNGNVLHGFKKSDSDFRNFGEIYFSEIIFGARKGWKKHLKMTMNLVVPIGKVKFIFFDDSKRIRKEIIGKKDYARITVPPKIWFAFEGLYSPYSLIMNISDIEHDPNEVERKSLDEITFI